MPTTTVPVYDVYARREALGLTQAQAARRCGLSLQTYAHIEQGRQDPTPATVRKLARGLKTSQASLRGER